jgi:hypothetical protein
VSINTNEISYLLLRELGLFLAAARLRCIKWKFSMQNQHKGKTYFSESTFKHNSCLIFSY